MASNWRVGGRKGVLSGKRFLVLCDNIVWAELREADRRCSLGEGGASNGEGGCGWLPLEVFSFAWCVFVLGERACVPWLAFVFLRPCGNFPCDPYPGLGTPDDEQIEPSSILT